MIKARTTKSKAKAISIPGRDGEDRFQDSFEDELYAVLLDQHQRIDLFVKSKSGEIKRRLDHLRQLIFNLTQRWQLGNQKRISVRRLERVSRAEGEVLKAGEEIQSLARFIAAQRLAFVKLLKKYKKWTGSSRLQTRFENEVLGKPQNFTQKDFGPLLEQWTDVLAAVRAPFEAGLSWKADADGDAQQVWPRSIAANTNQNANNPITPPNDSGESLHIGSSAAALEDVYKNGADVDVDTAFATVPLGIEAGKAAYWVHPDNIIQLHILLMQYTRLRRRTGGPDSPQSPTSSRSSRRGSAHGSVGSVSLKTDDEVTTIVCDDLKSFAERRNGATVNEIETQPGNIPQEAAVSIRYSSSESEATVAIRRDVTGQDNHWPRAAGQTVQRASLKRKNLEQLLPGDHKVSLPLRSVSFDDGTTNAPPSESDISSTRHWLHERRNIQPLTHLECTRSRFVGLGNNVSKGVWASLDKDVHMKKSPSEDLKDFSKSSVSHHRASVAFPHAVLEVRWEGSSRPELVKALDETYLTERVRGFSLETHAIFTLCRPPNMAAPYWLPALSRDIRKIPAAATRTKSSRRSSVAQNSTEAVPTGLSSPSLTTPTTDGPSSSGFSAVPRPESPATSAPDQLEVAPLQAFRKKRRNQKERPLHRQVVALNRAHQRYWNEFDDGEEGPADEAYTIFIDPNASSSFPGATAVSKLVTAASEKVSKWLGRASPNKKKDGYEGQPLIDDYFTQRPTAEDATLDSNTDSDNSSTKNIRPRRRYSTFPSSRHHVLPGAPTSRESLLLRCCIGSFIASLIFLAIASVLTITTRRRYVVTADIGTLVGVISSLVFAAVGVGMMVGRKDNVGWVHRSTVLLAFVGVCFGNVVLIGVVAGFL